MQPPLTDADRAALADIARQQERRPEESVDVSFDEPADGRAARTGADGER